MGNINFVSVLSQHINFYDFIPNTTKDKKEQKIYYFCYRNNFPIPLLNGATNDISWGCMIRTGQMMICETLQRIEKIRNKVKNIPELFFDDPSASFSIHNITMYGAKNNIAVGNWFSPTALSLTLEQLVNNNSIVSDHVNLLLSRDGIVYGNKVNEILDSDKCCLLLVPVMFGMEDINQLYYHQIKQLLQHKSSAGFIGGKQKKSLYLSSIQNDKVEYFDPHVIKPAFLSLDDDNQSNILSGFIELADLNSSMLLCFLIKSKEEFDEWYNEITAIDNAIVCIEEEEKERKEENQDRYTDSDDVISFE